MKIEKTSFGQIIINGEKYTNDIYIVPKNDEYVIQKRKKDLSYKIKGHTCFSEKEAEFLLTYKPEIFFIGKGQFGVLPIPEKTKEILESFAGEIIEDLSPKILKQINQAIEEKRKLVALIHITC